MLREPNAIALAELLPHQGPAILLERILSAAETTLAAQVLITPASRHLAPSGDVPVWFGLEYLAQAIAAHAGLRRRQAGQPLAPGLLLGSRRVTCQVDGFAIGQNLTVQVALEYDNGSVGSYSGVIADTHTRAELLTATLTVYQPPPGTLTLPTGHGGQDA